jgi:hypothetical protein
VSLFGIESQNHIVDRVVLRVVTSVSEERVASTFRVDNDI